MELLPILSTIILVGTLATLILAVAAYVLYKIRERQGRGAPAPPPSAPPQPLLLTAPAGHADTSQAEQLQELLRLAAAGLQQQQGLPHDAALPPAQAQAREAAPPAGWSAPAPPPAAAPSASPEPAWEEATFEDVTPLRASDLASFFDEADASGEEALETAPLSSPPSSALDERKDDHVAPRPRRPTERATPAEPAPAATPSGDDATSDGAAPDDDFQELLRLADELDTLLDLDAPETPPNRGEAASWD